MTTTFSHAARMLGACLLCALLALPTGAQDEGSDVPAALAETRSQLYKSMGRAEESGIAREFALQAMEADAIPYAIEALKEFLKKGVPNKNPELLSDDELEAFACAAESVSFLALCQSAGAAPRPDVSRWLLADNERLSDVVNTLQPRDDWRAACEILNTLHDHDPDDRDAYFNLIVAMALVWDQPHRPRHHHQMGTAPPEYEPTITARYDFFKKTYDSNTAKIAYRRLTIRALVFVVGSGVSLDELAWVQENVQGRLGSWKAQYFRITYDDGRLASSIFNWPHGDYTLKSIEQRGGICVDQAYFATLTAQAYGIPAMLFTGEGKRGGHAWIGYMRSEKEWEMDVGRYTYDKYATGSTVDPQTNDRMSDHDVAFASQRAFQRESFTRALRLTNIAYILLRLEEPSKARRYARSANSLVEDFERPWTIMEDILAARDDLDGLLSLLDAKVKNYRDFPDLAVETVLITSKHLRKRDRFEDALDRLEALGKRLPEHRTDLIWRLYEERIGIHKQASNPKEVTDLYEELLWDFRHEGEKLIPWVNSYVQHCREQDELDDALKFVDKLSGRMQQQYKDQFQWIMVNLYEELGEDRKAERLRKRLQ